MSIPQTPRLPYLVFAGAYRCVGHVHGPTIFPSHIASIGDERGASSLPRRLR